MTLKFDRLDGTSLSFLTGFGHVRYSILFYLNSRFGSWWKMKINGQLFDVAVTKKLLESLGRAIPSVFYWICQQHTRQLGADHRFSL